MPLNDSRIAAAKVLADSDASLTALQAVALELGNDLVAAAHDEALWNRLTARPDEVDAGRWNLLLRAMADVEWERLLTEAHYQPPPSVDEVAGNFRAALTVGSGLNGRGPRSTQVGQLGEELRAVARDPDSSKGRLRRWIRKGLRVAVPIAVAAAIGVALTPVLTAVAGAAILPAAAGLGIQAAAVGEAFIHACLDGAVGAAIDYAFDHVWPDD